MAYSFQHMHMEALCIPALDSHILDHYPRMLEMVPFDDGILSFHCLNQVAESLEEHGLSSFEYTCKLCVLMAKRPEDIAGLQFVLSKVPLVEPLTLSEIAVTI